MGGSRVEGACACVGGGGGGRGVSGMGRRWGAGKGVHMCVRLPTKQCYPDCATAAPPTKISPTTYHLPPIIPLSPLCLSLCVFALRSDKPFIIIISVTEAEAYKD